MVAYVQRVMPPRQSKTQCGDTKVMLKRQQALQAGAVITLLAITPVYYEKKPMCIKKEV